MGAGAGAGADVGVGATGAGLGGSCVGTPFGRLNKNFMTLALKIQN
jgi:hypothetical protein